MRENPFNRSETKEQEQKTIDEKTRYYYLLENIKKTFSTTHGLQVLNWLLAICHTGTSIFTGNSQTFYNAGQQDVGHEIVNKILEAEPEIYEKLLRQKATELRLMTVKKYKPL